MLDTTQLKFNFKGRYSFDTKDIANFYLKIEPDLKPTTINWRIYTLVKTGVLARIGRGVFRLGESHIFVPPITDEVKRLNEDLHHQFPYLTICIWNTVALNELMLHQPGKFYTLIEVEKDAMDAVFYFLRENEKRVFFDPSEEVLNRYVSGEQEALIVKSLVSEAPMQVLQGINTLTLEKMLVDIFCDDVLFAAQQGSELEHIFTEAFMRYTINESKMLRYANRKGRKEAFKHYLNKISKNWQGLTLAAVL